MKVRRKQAQPGRPPGWGSAIGLGFLIGAWVGCLEVLVLWLSPSAATTRESLLISAILYAVAGGVVGVIVTVAAALRRASPSRALSIAVLISFFALIMAAGIVNVRYLPSATSVSSIVVTGLMVIGAAGLGFGLYRVIRFLGRSGLGRRVQRIPVASAAWVSAGVLAIFVLLVTYWPTGGGRQAGEYVTPSSEINVIVVVIDALRPDHLSVYGYDRETSPEIDKWSNSGTVFENAFAQAPWTKPATASLLTGLYPSTHCMNLVASGLSRSLPVLPEVMRENGYRTGILTDNTLVSPLFGFQRGVDRFVVHRGSRFTQLTLGHMLRILWNRSAVIKGLLKKMTVLERRLIGGEAAAVRLGARGLTEAFLQWVDEEPDRAFFAYLHYMEPHAPYAPPSPYDERFLQDSLRGRPKVTNPPAFGGFLPFDRAPDVSPDSLESMIALYDAEIFLADEAVGVLIGGLRQRGLLENTLVVLTADHGEEFYEHGGWGHGHSLFGELLRVPLIMSGPWVIENAPRRVPHVVRHIDIFPTILELCSITPPEGLDGASVLPILQGVELPDPPRPVMSEVDHGGQSARALLDGGEKVVVAESGRKKRILFFDLASDPGETENIAEVREGRANELLAKLEEFHRIASEKAAAGSTVTIDPETRDRLKALGYIQ